MVHSETTYCHWEKAQIHQNAQSSNTNYLFAYGSLMWNPGIHFVSSKNASVRGFVRRFWNKSADHRGTADYYGLVACLVDLRGDARSSDLSVDGVLYELDRDRLPSLLEVLDFREKYGYIRDISIAYDHITGAAIGECFVYCACVQDETIDVFLSFRDINNTREELALIALRIHNAEGPSGKNIDYLRSLHRKLCELNFNDEHVTALVEIIDS